MVEPVPAAASEHNLKSELYSRARADSTVFEFLQAGSLDGIWYADLESPYTVWASARCKELFGYQEHEITDAVAWWRENILPEDRQPAIDDLAKLLADPSVPFHSVLRYRHKDGSTIWVRCRGLVISDIAGKPVRMLGVHTDLTALKRAEENLRALQQASPEVLFRDSELRFRQLTESLPQLVWTGTPEGVVDYLSPQWVLFTGVPEAQQLLRGWIDQLHPDDRAGLIATWAACVDAGTPYQYECRLRRHDGVYRWFDTRGIPLRAPDNGIIRWFGSCTDINEKKQVEADQRFLLKLGIDLQGTSGRQAIASSATHWLADYFEVARCALYSVDSMAESVSLIHSHTRTGKPSSFTTSPLSAWSTPGLVNALTRGDTVSVDDTSTHPDTGSHYLGGFKPAGVEALILVPMRREGRLVSLLSLFMSEPRHWTQRQIDLAHAATERIWMAYDAARSLEAERALHDTLASSERRLQLALQAAGIGIWEGYPQTNVSNWDERSRAIFGFPPDLRVDREVVMSCVHPEDLEATKKSMASYLDPAGSGKFESEFRIFPRNGVGIRHVLARAQMHYEGQGQQRKAVLALGTVQDITALKQGEQSLRRANRELEQFAYAAAHDLQEPLRNVALSSQILVQRYRNQFDRDAEVLLKIAAEGALRMQSMVKDLLAYSRVVSDDLEAVLWADPNSVLSLTLKNLLGPIVEKQAQVSWDPMPAVRMSEHHLMQVLQNLISNSLKYSGAAAPKIHIASTRRFGEVVFFVKDSGIGIDPQHYDRAFGVFKRLNAEDSGSGMGLALCKRIVEHYGGRIWIESQPGNGTTLLFTPPLAHSATADVNPSAAADVNNDKP